jgi:Bacterial regulatory proteins, luxR family
VGPHVSGCRTCTGILTVGPGSAVTPHLFLSEGTVKNHISRILGRLGLRDRTQAAIYARDHGLF